MGILGALSTAVSGLSAQSYALENISGNIANSQTVGFKRVDTSFVDLIPDSPVKRAAAGSVMSYSQLTNTLQGTLRTTNLSTNMALSGDGYFVVAKNEGSESLPIFNSINQYTRRGDFKVDANGFLENGANRYLVGTTYNPATGAVTGSSTSPIQIPTTSIPAKQSAEIQSRATCRTSQARSVFAKRPGSDISDRAATRQTRSRPEPWSVPTSRPSSASRSQAVRSRCSPGTARPRRLRCAWARRPRTTG
jgi:flagellar hook protein FlgE